MSKYTKQVNIKLSPELEQKLLDIAEYEGANKSELLRSWVREKIQEIVATRAFQRWLRKREGKPELEEEED